MAEFFTKDGENFVPVKETLHSQEDIDRILENRLDRERKKFSDYDELKSKVGTLQIEVDDKVKTFAIKEAEWEGKLQKATLETEKVKIVNEFKLPEDLAEFVSGDTAEDMRKRAEKLAKGAKGGSITIEKDGKLEKPASDNKAIASKLFGKKSDV